MRGSVIAVVAVALAVGCATSAKPPAHGQTAPHEEAVAWRSSFADAQADAGRSGRLVFLELTVPGCRACARLEHETYPDPEVRAALGAYVPVKIDATQDEALAERYGFHASPDLLLLTPDGEVLDRVSRFVSPHDLVAFLAAGRVGHSAAAGPVVHWTASFEKAEEQARASARPVFLFVWNYG